MKHIIIAFSFLLFQVLSIGNNGIFNVSYCDEEETSVIYENVLPLPYGIDSVILRYGEYNRAHTYIVKVMEDEITINVNFTRYYKHISDKTIRDQIVKYVDIFFISKSENIKCCRLKRDDFICEDYVPYMYIAVFAEGKKMIEEIIEMREEEFFSLFNPVFIDFYVLLTEQVKYLYFDK